MLCSMRCVTFEMLYSVSLLTDIESYTLNYSSLQNGSFARLTGWVLYPTIQVIETKPIMTAISGANHS